VISTTYDDVIDEAKRIVSQAQELQLAIEHGSSLVIDYQRILLDTSLVMFDARLKIWRTRRSTVGCEAQQL